MPVGRQRAILRAFVSIESLVRAQDSLLPVFECDGTHMKHNQYNGICLSLLGKDGNEKNIPLAIAFVHKETRDNFVWFFANYFVGGLRMNKAVTLSDRGKQRSAQEMLAKLGLAVNLKFCTLHIRFNVMDKFKDCGLDENVVNALIFRLQAAPTIAEYDKVIRAICHQFPKGTRKRGNAAEAVELVSDYLAKLHPTSWTQCGNGAISKRDDGGLSRSNVLRWKDQQDELRKLRGDACRLPGGGAKVIGEELHSTLTEKVLFERSAQRRVTRCIISVWAVDMKANMNIAVSICPSWVDRFMARAGFVLRKGTRKPVLEDREIIERGVLVVREVRGIMAMFSIQPANTYNLNDTAIFFDHSKQTTVHPKGAKDVPVQSFRFEKQCVIAVFCASTTGERKASMRYDQERTRPRRAPYRT